jgi:hypothetical protein
LPYLSHAERTDRANQGKEKGEEIVAEFKERWRALRHITTGHLLLPSPSQIFFILSLLINSDSPLSKCEIRRGNFPSHNSTQK